MTEGLKIFRLVPTAASDDPNWQNSPSHGEVIVRALTAGDARIVASEAELDFTEIDAAPAEGNSTKEASAFRNDKLYSVVADTSGRFSSDGERGVVGGRVRIDTIVPMQR